MRRPQSAGPSRSASAPNLPPQRPSSATRPTASSGLLAGPGRSLRPTSASQLSIRSGTSSTGAPPPFLALPVDVQLSLLKLLIHQDQIGRDSEWEAWGPSFASGSSMFPPARALRTAPRLVHGGTWTGPAEWIKEANSVGKYDATLLARAKTTPISVLHDEIDEVARAKRGAVTSTAALQAAPRAARRRVERRACAVQAGSAHRRTTFGGLGNVAETAELEAAVGALRLTAEVEASSSSSSSSSRTVATGVATAPFAHLTEGTELRVFVEVCSANREAMRSVKGSRERYDGAYEALEHRVRQTFGEDAARVAVLRNPSPSALPRPLARRLPSEWGGGAACKAAGAAGAPDASSSLEEALWMPSPMLKPCQLSTAAARARAARVSWRQPVSIAVSRQRFRGLRGANLCRRRSGVKTSV